MAVKSLESSVERGEEAYLQEVETEFICRATISVTLENNKERSSSDEISWARGFPGGAVVKNLPSNAGDMVSNAGPGRSHIPQSS